MKTKTDKKIKLNFKTNTSTSKLLKELKERERYVISERFGLNEPKKRTLDSIGKEYSITRERVRQIQDAALRSIRNSDTFEEARDIFEELEEVILSLGGVVGEEYLLENISKHKITQNHIIFYLVIGDSFKKHKEDEYFINRWSVDHEITESVHSALKKLHKDLSEEDLLKEEDLIFRFLDKLDGVEDGRVDLDIAKLFISLTKLIGKNPFGEWGSTSSKNIVTRGVRDLAYLIMRKNGNPLHFTEVAEEITKTFNKGANSATVHNELIKDKRFVLVGKGMYALKDWGYKSGVARDIIIEIIREKGPLNKEEVIENVLRERYLKPNTIMINLNNQKYFKKDVNGLYDLV